jgi:hypothetical protein
MTGVIIGGGVLLALLALLYVSDRRAKRAGHSMRTDFDMSYDAITQHQPDTAPGHSSVPDMKNRHRPNGDGPDEAPKPRGVARLKRRRD